MFSTQETYEALSQFYLWKRNIQLTNNFKCDKLFLGY